MPVKAIAGDSATGIAPRRTAGSSTSVPKRAAVCTTSWPATHTPASASPDTRAGSSSSGTATSTSSLRSTSSGTASTGAPGSIASARSRLSCDTA